MIAVIVLAAVLVLLVGGFLWFYLYSRTVAWGESETRRAMLRMLVVVGPIFGMHYDKPLPEPPTISTPGGDEPPLVPGLVIPPRDDEDERD